ncbi:agmatinase [Planifilum fulgidum]|jgi:agmatinase|uniref:Agmatinase n=1 Tax=Planifilum fulgidum TaxID=201973 RepID=A0A1I2LI43_9BACL|nr:agmatinase [Planifilum fulgidum]MBO2496378.1 agmatinase [Bacillota bacterium]SFF78723.1 agmatinase [Planifilum fulgidum]
MRAEEAYSGNVFIAAKADLEEARAVIYGMPMDWTASFRPGSRFGPRRIREVSLVLEEYSPHLGRELGEVPFYDAGDIPLPFGNPGRSLEKIGRFVAEVLQRDKMPIGLGGEHLVTWPVVREVYKHFPDLAVIHMDAHADLRTEYEGETLSHATPLRKIAELIGPENVIQLGIRSGTREEFEYAASSGIRFHPFEVLKPLVEELPALAGRPVYVTVDIDVLDPAFAPGTGTPEPAGITSRELMESLHAIARSEVKVVGADLVEVAPAYDPTDQTAVAAAKMVREMLLGFVPA